MIFKRINPVTPGQRQLKLLDKSYLSKRQPIKSQLIGLSNSGGRNNLGRITSYRKGGGHKKLYRNIDFIRKNTKGIVISIEHDPNRSCYIAGIFDSSSNKYSYILAPKGLKSGHIIKSIEGAAIKIGHSLELKDIPIGSFIHNIGLASNRGGQLVRAAGNYAQLIQKDSHFARVKLRSGEQRLIPVNCRATLGILSNENHNLISIGKAGRSRWLNRRPIVRGVAMNPVDHPHGGGEGKTSGGRPSVTPWGKSTKGQPTRNKKIKNKLIVVRRKN